MTKVRRVATSGDDAVRCTSESSVRLRRGAVEWREIDGEIVALEVESSTYIAANRSGGILWQRLTEGTTHDELVGELTTRYEVEPEQARTDVAGFLAALTARGLLEPTCAAPAA
jgi:hypothetical protein